MRIILTTLAFAALTTSASAQMSHAYPYDSDGTLNRHSRPASYPDDFVCHKDHAGLVRVAAEPAADAEARLNEALAGGGTLIVAGVDAIDCAACAQAIERALAARGEVAAASVNVRKGTISIVMRPGAAIADASIRKIVKHRGHQVAGIERVQPPMVAEN